MTSKGLSGRSPQGFETTSIEGASDAMKRGAGGTEYPWQDPKLRPDVKKLFNLILTEPQKAKLDYVGQHHGGAQKWLRDLVIPAIEAEIEKLVEEEAKKRRGK